MVRGIDCASRLTAQTAAAIRAEGYAFAGRYLVPSGWKALTKGEAEIITAAGLRLLTVWETTADRAKGGAAAGAVDGANALKCAHEIGMPARGIIYFAVDYGAQAGDMDVIEAYLRAARANTEEYEIGVYGSYSVVEEMARRGACKAFWQCVAWSYGKKSEYLNVYQGWFYQQAGGVAVDINECQDMDRAGIWTYETEKEDEDMTVYKKLKDIPDDFRPTIQKLMEKGALVGEEDSDPARLDDNLLNLSYDYCRVMTTLDRLGKLD